MKLLGHLSTERQYVVQGSTNLVAELDKGTIWLTKTDSCNLNIIFNGEKWKGKLYLSAVIKAMVYVN